jgi:1-phosphofructokinase family hexose kinase
LIICISANPAIDKRVFLDAFVTGKINRAARVLSAAGGKAAHVAMALRALGEEVTWIGFAGAESGARCVRELRDLGIDAVPIATRSETRTNLEIIDRDGLITELLEPGGAILPEEREQLLATCRDHFSHSRQPVSVVLSGSLSPGLEPGFYGALLELAHIHRGRTYLDTSGQAFSAALPHHPHLIKPNRPEAEAVLDCASDSAAAPLGLAHALQSLGARRIALSMGVHGLALLSEDAQNGWLATPPSVSVASTVGCGDSTLAGLVYGERQGMSDTDLVRFATACGTANCLAPLPGRISLDTVRELVPQVSVRPID